VPAGGGPPTAIVDSVNFPGAAIGEDGSVFYWHSGSGLHRKAASGGPSVALATLDRSKGEFAHWSPDVLPGGKAVIFTNYVAPATSSRIEAVNIATGQRKVLVEGAVFGRYATSGHLLFARGGAVFAVAFDAGALRVIGTPVPVVEDVAWSLTFGLAAFAVSANGTLVYARASEASSSRGKCRSTTSGGNRSTAVPRRRSSRTSSTSESRRCPRTGATSSTTKRSRRRC
jgi:hypothetical protein